MDWIVLDCIMLYAPSFSVAFSLTSTLPHTVTAGHSMQRTSLFLASVHLTSPRCV